mmetsp:Transcript_33130/g.42590  ORF Transcript_33130/g.42590 Transcript_33130/m.42590 type:complete len:226 (-) Transcript_33130:80-757(-)
MSLLSKATSFVKRFIPLHPDVLLDTTPPPSRVLACFKQPIGLKDFHVVTDDTISGSSTASFVYQSSKGTSFGRFQGTLSKRVRGNNEPVISGFAALQRVLFEPKINIHDYQYIDIKMRSDGRPYMFNLRLESVNPLDRYQGVLQTDSYDYNDKRNKNKNKNKEEEGWSIQRLNLQNLLLTINGRESTMQRKMDGYSKLMSIGLFTADGVDGSFCIDIADITLTAK